MSAKICPGTLHFRAGVSSFFCRLFQSCVEDVNLSGLAVVDASWLAYVGAYTHLRSLNLSACKNVTDASLWHLLGGSHSPSKLELCLSWSCLVALVLH